jgi:hypothetical protein
MVKLNLVKDGKGNVICFYEDPIGKGGGKAKPVTGEHKIVVIDAPDDYKYDKNFYKKYVST